MQIIAWKDSIFTKFVLIFILIMAVLYFTGYNIYHQGLRTAQEIVTNSYKSQVTHYLDNIENEIKNIQTLIYGCVNDINLLQLAQIPQGMGDYKKITAVQQLNNRLVAIQFSSPYIEKVSAHIPAFNRTVSSSRSINEIPNERLEYLLKALEAENEQIICVEGNMTLALAHPSNIGYKPPLFVLDVQLSEDAIKDDLMLFSDNYSGTILILPHMNIIADNNPDKELINEVISGISQDNGENDAKTVTIKTSGGKYLVVYDSAASLNMKLIKFMPEENVFHPMKQYQVWFILFSLIAAIIVLILLFSAYNLIHRPLKKLVNAFFSLEKGELKIKIRHRHKDEFHYLYQRFNIMTESLNTLIEQVYEQKILNNRQN